ncbi:MAG: hypothetical protein AABO41_22820 [Acidobacteriota bacterium]
MSTRKAKGAFFGLMIAAAFAAGFLVLANPSYRAAGSQNQEKLRAHEGTPLPLAHFSVQQSGTNAEQALRTVRSSRYDKSYPSRLDELRPDTVERSRITHFWVNLPALPTSESDAVLLGDVTDAHGYVSNDKTGAYSEFTIRIEQIFKDDGHSSGGLVTAEREGADVRLPTGRMIRYRIADQVLPILRGRYVFFLKYDPQGEDYHILTAYGLEKGRVFPLDESVGRFAIHKGADEGAFLKTVSEAVVHPPPAPQDARRLNQ